MSAAADQLSRMAELTDATQQYLTQLSGIAEQMEQLRSATESLTAVSNTLLQSYRNITENSEGISDTSQGYVSGMETLNRNISGLNTIYEIQLKSISSQLDNIDRVNNGLKTFATCTNAPLPIAPVIAKQPKNDTIYTATQFGLRKDDHGNDHQHVQTYGRSSRGNARKTERRHRTKITHGIE